MMNLLMKKLEKNLGFPDKRLGKLKREPIRRSSQDLTCILEQGKKMSNFNIREEIFKIIYEIDNPRNDGWVRGHYIEKLRELKIMIDKKIMEIDNKVL